MWNSLKKRTLYLYEHNDRMTKEQIQKSRDEARDLALGATAETVEFWISMMKDTTVKPELRMRASENIAETGLGKPSAQAPIKQTSDKPTIKIKKSKQSDFVDSDQVKE